MFENGGEFNAEDWDQTLEPGADLGPDEVNDVEADVVPSSPAPDTELDTEENDSEPEYTNCREE